MSKVAGLGGAFRNCDIVSPQYRTLGLNTHELTCSTLNIWDRLHTQNKWDYNSPLIYLKDNEFFEPGNRSVGGNRIKKENAQLKDIIKSGKISTYQELRLDRELMTIDEWRYIQLKHFVEKLPQPIRFEEDYRPMERLCMREKFKNTISRIYKILSAGDELDVPSYIKKWENALGSQCNKHTLEKILKLTHNSALDTKTAETNCKCIARWYATPNKISKFQLEMSSDCWRGCKALGTMVHIWWDCPIIKKIWKEVLQLIKEITNIEISEDLWTCLFHGIDGSVRQYKTSIFPTLLNVAKSLIPKKSQEAEKPKIRDWIFCVNALYNLESLDDRGRNRKKG